MRLSTLGIGIGALVGLGILASGTRRPSAGAQRPFNLPGGDKSPLELGSVIADATGWVGLPTFFTAVAQTESNGGVPDACAKPCGPTSARGMFQLKPSSALVHDYSHLQSDPSILFDPSINAAFYAWYLWRLRSYGKGQINWLALRRGGAYPSLVSDVAEEHERSRQVRERFTKALDELGVPRSFMYEPAYPPSLEWPGIEEVLRIVDY